MRILCVALLAFCACSTWAAIKVDTVEYKHGDEVLEGYLAYDDAVEGARPGVIVVHDWMGNGEFSKKKAEDLAKLGYVGFAADIYGKGVHAKDAKEAAQLAGKYKSDRAYLRARVTAAL